MKAFKLVHFKKMKSHLHIMDSFLLDLQDEQWTLAPDEAECDEVPPHMWDFTSLTYNMIQKRNHS